MCLALEYPTDNLLSDNTEVNDLLKTLLKCFIGLVLIFANANYKAFVALIF